LNELALFAGAGGGILGGHLLGWQCVCAVEYEPFQSFASVIGVQRKINTARRGRVNATVMRIKRCPE